VPVRIVGGVYGADFESSTEDGADIDDLLVMSGPRGMGLTPMRMPIMVVMMSVGVRVSVPVPVVDMVAMNVVVPTAGMRVQEHAGAAQPS